jgi:hypothetical protein
VSALHFALVVIGCNIYFSYTLSPVPFHRLQLLNTTVASIALFVNNVLTASYNAIYGSEEDETELILVVAPISSNTEIQSLYTAGLIDFETALPAALHSLGCSAEEIASAMERRRTLEKNEAAIKEIESKTNKAELERREKDAKNPPDRAAASKSAAPKPKSSTPSEPDSD